MFTNFGMELRTNIFDPDQTAPNRSSLILVDNVCDIGVLKGPTDIYNRGHLVTFSSRETMNLQIKLQRNNKSNNIFPNHLVLV